MITLSASLAGRSHLVGGRVNQDSVASWHLGQYGPQLGGAASGLSVHPDLERWLKGPVGGEGVVLAVADGHGSERYDRSHIGSTLAVTLALAQCGQLLPRLDRDELDSTWLETEWPRRLSQQWRRLVLSTKRDSELTSEADFITRHGTTLLGALLVHDSVLLFQIGDGEVLVITDQLEVRRPVPERIKMLGSEVESLSQIGADGAFRVAHLPLRRDQIRMVIMASDGVTNSFVEEDGFADFALQTLDRALGQAPGGYPVQKVLQRAIARCSSFTGDDVSIAVAINDDLTPRRR